MPCTGILGVLEQAVGECADRAGAQPDDDVGGVVGKALEIAAQRSVRRRPRQRVLGQREMIEADSPVARPGQPLMRQRRLAETRRRAGESRRIDAALARNEVRHMRIAEHRQPFRASAMVSSSVAASAASS